MKIQIKGEKLSRFILDRLSPFCYVNWVCRMMRLFMCCAVWYCRNSSTESALYDRDAVISEFL